ncbi:hypothetical protein U1Q18_006345 [Sarracenia purpurea var. burkii]
MVKVASRAAKTSTGDGNLTFRVAVGDGNCELGLLLEKRWLPLKTRPRALERRRRTAGGIQKIWLGL